MSDNLNLPQVSASQNQKEVTINDAIDQLSSAMTDDNSYDFTSGDVTLTLGDFQDYLVFVAINNSVLRNFNLPVQKRAFFGVWNDGTATLNVVLGSTTFTVQKGFATFFRQDGTANGLYKLFSFQIASSGGGGGSGELDYPVTFFGRPLTGAQGSSSVATVLNRKAKLPSGLPGSNFTIGSGALPTADMTFTLYKNGSSIGTVKYAATTGAVTVTFSSDETFNVGDVFEVVPPNPRDNTGGNISMNFAFTLTA